MSSAGVNESSAELESVDAETLEARTKAPGSNLVSAAAPVACAPMFKPDVPPALA